MSFGTMCSMQYLASGLWEVALRVQDIATCRRAGTPVKPGPEDADEIQIAKLGVHTSFLSIKSI